MNAKHYSEFFLMAAITSILTIRLFLKAAGYPYLGTGDLHIAHVLWGGFLMLGAVLIAFFFLGKGALQWVAVVSGIGFGTFIDEVGKFLSQDNDYFFQPSVAIIYVVLISLFLTIKNAASRQEYSEKEYLINTLEEIREMELNDLDEIEQKRTLQYLARCNPKDPLVASLTDFILKKKLAPPRQPNIFVRTHQKIRKEYYRLATRPEFSTGIVCVFILEMAFTLITTLALVFLYGLNPEQIWNIHLLERTAEKLNHLSFIDWAHLGSSWISTLFILLGIMQIKKSRLLAFQMFERALLVSIFLTQIFSFYKEQFSALSGLIINILLLTALRSMMDHERLKRQSAKDSLESKNNPL